MSQPPTPQDQPPHHEPDPFPKMIIWVTVATFVLFLVIGAVIFVDFLQRAREGSEHPRGRPPVELLEDMPPGRVPHEQPGLQEQPATE